MKTSTSLMASFICAFSFAQDIEIESFATGLSSPTNVKHAGDNRLFVTERAGLIKIVDDTGTVSGTPFLNIDPRVINFGGEQGLLSIAFHPNYAANGYFYVNYVNNSGDTVISRFTRSTISTADPNSELILMTITQPFSNHNGGDLHFGADGYLYISTGDGGSGGDPGDRAQSLTTLLGKMLRIDVDNVSGGNNYAIPADNPYVGNPAALDEIWAYGLRNPWKFSFDRQNNDLWIADVGQGSIEEINRVEYTESGLNYGWRCYEGNSPFNTSGCPSAATMTFPVAQYNHSDGANFKCSITGGYRYRGTAQPNLQGLYFFADYCSDEIGYVEQSGATFSLTFLDQYNTNGWSAFAEDIDGELYIVGLISGNIFKIVDANLSVDENDLFEISMYPNPAKNSLTFDYSNSAIQLETINFYDTLGKQVKKVTQFDNELTTISTKNLSNGLYLVEIVTANGHKKVNKLIIN